MAYFYSLRGWLEVEPENFDKLVTVVKAIQSRYSESTKQGLYLRGWCWQETPINWTRYLFYGADVTEEGLLLFEKTLDELTAIGLNISGYFHIQGEDGEKNLIYEVFDDYLNKKMSKVLISINSI